MISESSRREKIPILYVARGQAQVMCNLYLENVPEGGMDVARHRDLFKQHDEYLVKF